MLIPAILPLGAHFVGQYDTLFHLDLLVTYSPFVNGFVMDLQAPEAGIAFNGIDPLGLQPLIWLVNGRSRHETYLDLRCPTAPHLRFTPKEDGIHLSYWVNTFLIRNEHLPVWSRVLSTISNVTEKTNIALTHERTAYTEAIDPFQVRRNELRLELNQLIAHIDSCTRQFHTKAAEEFRQQLIKDGGDVLLASLL